MRVAILGSGLMGAKLGTIWTKAGHDVLFTYARSADKLKRLARKAGDRARAGTPGEAAAWADVLLISVHWLRFADVLRQTGPLAGKTVITCALPMNRENTELALGRTSSAAEALQNRIPKARVVSAFNTVPSEVFFGVYAARRRANRPDLVLCGDHAGAKRIASRLIRDVGFAPVDAGPLRIARYTEPFALLMAQLAYERPGGPELAYRFPRYR